MKDIRTEILDTTEQIRDLVGWLLLRHAPPGPVSPTMYIDLEGVNLCRDGSISIFTLLIDTGIPTGRACLIDVHKLGAEAFTTAGAKGQTLKDILQNEQIPKVFFDVRNDSDALFAHFGIALQGVQDVQLMESATRETTASRKFLNGLAKCVESNMLTSLGRSGLASWKLAKEKGGQLFMAAQGGSYEVFNTRPIPEAVTSYCVGDVQHLPELRDWFWTRQTSQWRDLVREQTKKRVRASQRPDYQPHGRNKAIAPWSKEENITLDNWNCVAYSNYPDGPFDGEDDWYDDGPTSCRDIINDCDLHYYYSD